MTRRVCYRLLERWLLPLLLLAATTTLNDAKMAPLENPLVNPEQLMQQLEQMQQQMQQQRQLLLQRQPAAAAAAAAAAASSNTNHNASMPNSEDIRLATHPLCAADVGRVCGGGGGGFLAAATAGMTNIDVLRCILDNEASASVGAAAGAVDNAVAKSEELIGTGGRGGVSVACHHLVWQYRHDVTRSQRAVTAVRSVCAGRLTQACDQTAAHSPSDYVLCVAGRASRNGDSGDVDSSGKCRRLLDALSLIMFTDYRLIEPFAAACQSDIGRRQCGRVEATLDSNDGGGHGKVHQQGATIECLSRHLSQLQPQCRTQVLRVAELQADDYHMDRPLYFACRDDQQALCGQVRSGEGRVYKCLREHVANDKMSSQCRDEVRRRERLVAADFRVSHRLMVKCAAPLHQSGCLQEQEQLSHTSRLATIVICLEDYSRRGNNVEGACLQEMYSHRRTMMRDYWLSPELVAQCHNDIDRHCSGHREWPLLGGQVIHCLMRAASVSVTNQVDQQVMVTEPCHHELNTLMRMSDVAQNWRVDPVLERACAPVVQEACSAAAASTGPNANAEVFSCLMQSIGSSAMQADCENALIQLQYFIMRDYALDHKLYEACWQDVAQGCSLPVTKLKDNSKPLVSRSAQPHVMPCLYRLAYTDYNTSSSSHKLSHHCRANVRRVMKRRGNMVGLHPDVEQACLSQLGRLCSQFTYQHGRDMQCLIDQYSRLTGECADVMKQLIKDRERFVELDPVISDVCKGAIKHSCMDEANSEGVMQCLVELKTSSHSAVGDDHSGGMTSKCRAAVTHFQVVTQPDYEFSHRFKKLCAKDVHRLCAGAKTRSEVTSCLSHSILTDKLHGRVVRVSKPCVKQVELYVLQREDSAQLDPKLQQACHGDISRHCSHLSEDAHDGQVLECLRSKQDELSKRCGRIVFARQQEALVLDDTDLVLMRTCKTMIVKYCDQHQRSASDIVDCLKAVSSQPGFDGHCNNALQLRAVEQSRDFRLHPAIVQDCRAELNTHCGHIVDEVGLPGGAGGGGAAEEPENQMPLAGRVLLCLESVLRRQKASRRCSKRLLQAIREAAANTQRDPQLLAVCDQELRQICGHPSNDESNESDGGGECLRRALVSGAARMRQQCRDYVAQLIEDVDLDVHTDPQLSSACAVDLQRHCGDVAPGGGALMRCLKQVQKPTEACGRVLALRLEMLAMAVKVHPVDSLGDLLEVVELSPHGHVWMAVATAAVAVLFFCGMCCGRVTKRQRRENKNK